jgi:hypothetical protein
LTEFVAMHPMQRMALLFEVETPAFCVWELSLDSFFSF